MLNETNISCFLCLAETLSFTETARRLYLSQQAVSKNIMSLEMDLGFSLFNRYEKKITLTEEGEKCAKLLTRLTGEFNTEVENIKKDLMATNRCINIGYQNLVDFGNNMTAASYKMRSINPGVLLKAQRFSPGELTQKLYSNDLDVIILYERYIPDNPDYNIRRFMGVDIDILYSLSDPLSPAAKSLKELEDLPYIVDIFDGESKKALSERIKKESDLLGFQPMSVVTVPNRESAYLTAELNGGVLLCTSASQVEKSHRLKRYHTGQKDYICCAWRKSSTNKNIEQYVDLLISAYK